MRIKVLTQYGPITGVETPVIYLRENANPDVPPTVCQTAQEAADAYSRWCEMYDNIHSPFTLTTPGNEIYIIPPNILRNSIVIIQESADNLRRYIPQESDDLKKVGGRTGPADAPGIGGEEESGNTNKT